MLVTLRPSPGWWDVWIVMSDAGCARLSEVAGEEAGIALGSLWEWLRGMT